MQQRHEAPYPIETWSLAGATSCHMRLGAGAAAYDPT